MPKAKTVRGALKRLRVASSGRIKRRKANHSHILTKKNQARKRILRSVSGVSPANVCQVKRMLPHS